MCGGEKKWRNVVPLHPGNKSQQLRLKFKHNIIKHKSFILLLSLCVCVCVYFSMNMFQWPSGAFDNRGDGWPRITAGLWTIPVAVSMLKLLANPSEPLFAFTIFPRSQMPLREKSLSTQTISLSSNSSFDLRLLVFLLSSGTYFFSSLP